MNRRAWGWLGGAALALGAGVATVGDPARRPWGDVVLAAAGVATAITLWLAAPRAPGARGWRLLAVAPLFPLVGAAFAAALHPADPVALAALRWLPTVPGYLLAIAGVLTLVRPRLQVANRRGAVELALFLTASLVVVSQLVLGPGGHWSDLDWHAQLILGAAVVATSATMAAALTLLGAIEGRRQRMALILLAGALLLTAGRGLGTAALLMGRPSVADAGRLSVVAGLAFLALAGLVDPGPSTGANGERRPAGGRAAALGHLLPHVAMVVAVAVIAAVTVDGPRPSIAAFAGVVGCVALAAVHRWLAAGDERRLGSRLRRSEAYFRSLVRSSGDAAVILDGELRVTWASPALDRMLGAPAAGALRGRFLLDAVHPEDAGALAAALPISGADDEPAAVGGGLLLLRLAHTDGAWRYLEAGVSDLRDDADVGAVVLHCRDMTERHAREVALQSVAYTDPATGLPNRAGWLRHLDQVLGQSDTAEQGPTLLLVELDGLAEARQRAGRQVTTTLVAEVGRRLRATVRGEDLVARLGSGAFAVVAAGSAADADQLAARCLSVIEQPIVTADGLLELTGSVGLARVEPGLTSDELRSRAELAVHAARALGLGRAARWTPAIGEAADRRARLRADLDGARDRGELSLAFQPVVSLDEQRVTGVEALLRWRHPTLGEVAPREFVAIAEQAGLIGGLQRWVLQEATAVAASLPSSGLPLRIGVNVSAVHLAGGTVVADVEAALRASGLSPERLILEITEAAVLSEQAHVAMDVATLRLMGVHVALDDFGTGWSALSHLTKLPLDVLKLDEALVMRVDRDPQSLALCRSIVAIGRELGLDVVAEGVETPAQLAALCGAGCGFAQGFLLARPMPQGELVAMLRERAGQLWPGLVAHR